MKDHILKERLFFGWLPFHFQNEIHKFLNHAPVNPHQRFIREAARVGYASICACSDGSVFCRGPPLPPGKSIPIKTPTGIRNSPSERRIRRRIGGTGPPIPHRRRPRSERSTRFLLTLLIIDVPGIPRNSARIYQAVRANKSIFGFYDLMDVPFTTS